MPNFRNLGTLLRILLMVNAMAAAAAFLRTESWRAMWQELIEISALLQPLLILCLLALAASDRLLRRLPYRQGASLVLALVLAATALVYFFARNLPGSDSSALGRYWLLALLVSGVMLAYFNLRSRALSPALAEARLQALQSRIRPHFLFNSINAVLSLIRAEPKRAENALEDMAELFRTLMADNRELSTVARELELCRQYLGLEQLRLGERLQVEWHTENMPQDALIPPLMLQPLLENAVYHGIEPAIRPGVVSINLYVHRGQVHVVIRNPYQTGGNPHHAGNKMALSNIRERLSLHFDAEASLKITVSEDGYQVHIIMPYVTAGRPA